MDIHPAEEQARVAGCTMRRHIRELAPDKVALDVAQRIGESVPPYVCLGDVSNEVLELTLHALRGMKGWCIGIKGAFGKDVRP